MTRWGFEGPPAEAYSRVTDPERFRPLHPAALQLLQRLEAAFDVEREEGYGLNPELERRDRLARPSIRLTPRDSGAAPLVVVFTAFPGLLVRFGRWHQEHFPPCGCDACDETAGEEIPRLEALVEDVTAGRFREALRLPLVGAASRESELWSPNGRAAGSWSRLERSRARELLGGHRRRSFEWKPWPRRPAS